MSPPEPTASSRRPSPVLRQSAAPVLGGLAFAAVFVVRTAFRVDGRLHFSLFDDSMISMRYARNLADGAGLVWNAGEPAVEGYTNFLWTLWMGVVHLGGLPGSLTSLAVMASSAVLLAATTVLTGAVARRVAPDRPLAATVAMWLTALSYPLVFWSLRGMEVALVAATTAGAVLLSLRLRDAPTVGNALALGAVVAVGLLTRDDVLVTAVVVCAFAVVTAGPSRRREVGGTLAAVLVGALAAHTAFRLAYYGDVVPNTYHLKLGGIALGTRVERGLTTLLVTAVSQAGAAAVVAGAGLAALGRRAHPGAVLMAAVVSAQAGYSVYVGGDAWEWMEHANRYLAPVLPELFVLAGLGVSVLLETRDQGRPGWLLWAGAASLALAGVAGLVGTPAALEYLAPREPQSDLVPVVLLAVVGGSLAAVAVAGHRVPRSMAVGGLTVVLLAALNGGPAARWATDNAALVGGDEAWTRYGLALRRATRPGATVAVAAAGAISYFSDRRIVDMLGKSDREIARSRPQPVPLLPGHVKWDYRHSIGELRPDVVAHLFLPAPADLRLLADMGYEKVGAALYFLPSSPFVDPGAMRALGPLSL